MIWANLLTILRLVMAPAVFWAITAGRDHLVLALLASAAASDVADGRVARAAGGATRLGAILDPVADKAVIGAALIGMASMDRLPAWLAWIYLGKELLQLAGGAFFLGLGSGMTIRANRFGKAATTATFAGFFALWLGWGFGRWLVLAGLGIGLLAAWSYLRLALGRLHRGND